MRLALIQFKTEKDPRINLKRISELIREAKSADLVILPEACIFPFGTKHEENTNYLIKFFSSLAKELNIYLVAGSIPEVTPRGTYNTSFVFDTNGENIAKHRKVYLYDVDLPNLKVSESRTYIPGEGETVFDTPFGKIGLLLCYDLRFPKLFIECALEGAHTIILPAAFSNKTGPKHWELLLRARALDSQCFIVGCGAAENTDQKFNTYGHSLVSSPNGDVEVAVDGTEQIIFYDYDPSEVQIYRKMIPVLEKQRKDERD